MQTTVDELLDNFRKQLKADVIPACYEFVAELKARGCTHAEAANMVAIVLMCMAIGHRLGLQHRKLEVQRVLDLVASIHYLIDQA